jgi:hypothetical protein
MMFHEKHSFFSKDEPSREIKCLVGLRQKEITLSEIVVKLNGLSKPP